MEDFSNHRTEAEGKLRSLRNPFPAAAISKLPRRYKDRQGNWQTIELDYVGHADLTERLLDADIWYTWEPLAYGPDLQPLFVTDRAGNPIGLWIRLTVCGRSMLGYGSCEPGKPDAVKELIGDALRNAAMRMGAALDLWKKAGPAQARANAEAATEPVAAVARHSAKADQVADMVSEVEGQLATMFGGEPATESADEVDGVPLNFDGDLTAIMDTQFPFGKHKGKTLGQLMGEKDGSSYIEWMKDKTVDEYRAGKKPSPINRACLIVWKTQIAK
jgi:uncharacterized protein (DUF3820 family)